MQTFSPGDIRQSGSSILCFSFVVLIAVRFQVTREDDLGSEHVATLLALLLGLAAFRFRAWSVAHIFRWRFKTSSGTSSKWDFSIVTLLSFLYFFGLFAFRLFGSVIAGLTGAATPEATLGNNGTNPPLLPVSTTGVGGKVGTTQGTGVSVDGFGSRGTNCLLLACLSFKETVTVVGMLTPGFVGADVSVPRDD